MRGAVRRFEPADGDGETREARLAGWEKAVAAVLGN